MLLNSYFLLSQIHPRSSNLKLFMRMAATTSAAAVEKQCEHFLDKNCIQQQTYKMSIKNSNQFDCKNNFSIYNPAFGEIFLRIYNCDVEDTKHAIQKASEAWKSWSKLTVEKRSQLLHQWYTIILDNKIAVANILVMENGKPLQQALDEIEYAAKYIHWFAEESKRHYGQIIPPPSSDKRLFVFRQSIGVCGVITPWNFPAAMLTRKVAAALAVGCTCVCKPSEDAPLTSVALGMLAKKAGIPDGVLNILTCSRENAVDVGKEICSNTLIRKVSFTGSTAVGKLILKLCSDTVKKVTVELGGNAPFIIFEDADIDAAVNGAIQSKFRASGQTCVCPNRFFVHKSIWHPFLHALIERVKNLAIGNGLAPNTELGPLISQKAVEKMEYLVNEAERNGAKLLYGGFKSHLAEPHHNGYFFEPTILDCRKILNSKKLGTIASEEIFGPIIALYSFEDDKDVIKLANSSPSGLAGYFYTTNFQRIMHLSESLDLGMVGVNTGVISHVEAPFGGIKESGIGREGSSFGLDDYTELKFMCLGGIK